MKGSKGYKGRERKGRKRKDRDMPSSNVTLERLASGLDELTTRIGN
jgi:hypothetical protein